MTPTEHFKSVVPGYMAKLLRDFPELGVLDAAAVFGNSGHESGGLVSLQEIKPTVAGSRGGWGWMQWTGPRRRAFESYCSRNGLNPAAPETNYKYLWLELKGYEGSEKAAIGKMLAASTLEGKVKAFEMAFLRAGVKHYAARNRWANMALEAWNASPKMLTPDPFGGPAPAKPAPAPKPVPSIPLPGAANPVGTANGKGVVGGVISAVLVAIAVAVWFVFFKR